MGIHTHMHPITCLCTHRVLSERTDKKPLAGAACGGRTGEPQVGGSFRGAYIFTMCRCELVFLMTGSLGSRHSSGPELPNARSHPYSLPTPMCPCATLKPRREGAGRCVRVAGGERAQDQ